MPNPGPFADANDRSHFHLDATWEIEMAELAEQKERREHAFEETGLTRLLHRLNDHYGDHTPRALPDKKLPKHAKYLDQRYRDILRRVAHLTDPEVAQQSRLRNWLREHVEAEIFYQCVNGWRDAILDEMKASVKYWQWVRKHHHLPHALHPKLTPFNDRPMAHPWKKVQANTLEQLARLEHDLELNR